jgi:hypothetical protein
MQQLRRGPTPTETGVIKIPANTASRGKTLDEEGRSSKLRRFGAQLVHAVGGALCLTFTTFVTIAN